MIDRDPGKSIIVAGQASERGVDDYLRRLGTAAIIREVFGGLRPWAILLLVAIAAGSIGG